jgi:peptide-methionine (S)-S-oxide reductase
MTRGRRAAGSNLEGVLGLFASRMKLVSPEKALGGRDTEMPVPGRHAVLGTPLTGPWPAGFATAVFALGCFWGEEKTFWDLDGVYSTAVGYAGGYTPNPTYKEVCSGRTGHTESVLVAFDPSLISYADLLRTFWESHDPTQGMRQGRDVGTQYRSAIFVQDAAQRQLAEASRVAYQDQLTAAGYGAITTDILDRMPFYYAEEYHQQYLFKVPNGYCPTHSTGVACPVGLGVDAR